MRFNKNELHVPSIYVTGKCMRNCSAVSRVNANAYSGRKETWKEKNPLCGITQRDKIRKCFGNLNTEHTSSMAFGVSKSAFAETCCQMVTGWRKVWKGESKHFAYIGDGKSIQLYIKFYIADNDMILHFTIIVRTNPVRVEFLFCATKKLSKQYYAGSVGRVLVAHETAESDRPE